jgi:hypothetical protein
MQVSLNDALADLGAMAVNDTPVADLTSVRKDGDMVVEVEDAIMVSGDNGGFYMKLV